VLGPTAGDQPRLVARAPGYLLRVEPGELDLERFEQLVAEGREALAANKAAAAAASLRAAEGLWEGRPLADLEFEPFTRVEVERLEELRLAAVEERIDAELALAASRDTVWVASTCTRIRGAPRAHLAALDAGSRQAKARNGSFTKRGESFKRPLNPSVSS
jgi:hypothetical protein